MIHPLQSLRFVFVMLIVMSHLTLPGHTPFDAGGDCGVAFFFILSGFILSHRYTPSILEGSYSHPGFLRRRLLKVYPLHLLCLAVWLLVFGHTTVDGRVVANALLLQSWIPLADYYFSCNAVSWFLSTLLFCYLVFPIAHRHASWAATALLLAGCLIVYLLVPYSQVGVLYVHPLMRSVDFFLGIMLHRLWAENSQKTWPKWTEWAVVALLIVVLATYPAIDAKLRNAPLFWVVLLPLIAIFAKGTGHISPLLNLRPMQWLGSLSMPIFMTHLFVISTLVPRLASLPDALAIILVLAAVVAVGWATDRLFLRPLASLLK